MAELVENYFIEICVLLELRVEVQVLVFLEKAATGRAKPGVPLR